MQLLTFLCPETSSPAVCRIGFSISSLRCRLLSFCYITDDMESRSQWQCSAKHDGTTRAHPDKRKVKVKRFFRALHGETFTTHLYTLPSAVAVPFQNTSRRHCMNSQTPTQWHSKPRALRAVEVHPDRKSSSECKLCGEPSGIFTYSTWSRQKWPTFKSGPLMFPIGTAFVGTVVKSLRGMPVRMSIFPDGFTKLSLKFLWHWNVHWRTVNQSKG